MMEKWRYLIGLRFLLLLTPLTGYIHPDEYFQSVEIVTGDILDLKVSPSWEFAPETASDKRIRSVAIPFLTIGLPMWILKSLSVLSEQLFTVSLISPLLICITSRLTYCAFSLLIDWSMYRICQRNRSNYKSCLLVLSTSYVTLIYFGRTLSNSIEAVLFACLMDTVSESIHLQKLPKTLSNKFSSTNPLAKSNINSGKIAVLLVLGIYNRPTFVLFAFVPVLFWTIGHSQVRIKNIINYFKRGVSLLPGILIVGLILSVIDTAYYNSNFCSKFLQLKFSLDDFIITPLNFVMYNVNPDNLALHGKHSHWTHSIVNLPLLFGPLIFLLITQLFESAFWNWISVSSVDWLMKLSFAVPLVLLSAFSHQEPRFIIGLIFPLSFIYADRLMRSNLLIKIWIIFNMACCFFYGYLHQGGVVPSLNYIYNHQSTFLSDQQNINVIYYHTYMPPRCLLLNYQSKPSEIRVFDLKGASLDTLQKTLDEIEKGMLISPSSLRTEIYEALNNNFVIQLNNTIKLHLSLEDPPPISDKFFDYFGLDIYIVKKNYL